MLRCLLRRLTGLVHSAVPARWGRDGDMALLGPNLSGRSPTAVHQNGYLQHCYQLLVT